jgi:hypothetical protein
MRECSAVGTIRDSHQRKYAEASKPSIKNMKIRRRLSSMPEFTCASLRRVGRRDTSQSDTRMRDEQIA